MPFISDLSNSGVDEVLRAFEDKTYKRPDYLTFNNITAKPAESTASPPASSSICDEGVTVVGADSLSASPTVSSGNGSLSFSITSDSEEVAHLRGEFFLCFQQPLL